MENRRNSIPSMFECKNRTIKEAGYRGFGNDVYCLVCLVKDASIIYDENQPITKQQAYKENLVCSQCGRSLITEKYRAFLERVKGKGKVLRRGKRKFN